MIIRKATKREMMLLKLKDMIISLQTNLTAIQVTTIQLLDVAI